MQILSSSERVPIKGFTDGVPVETEALQQLKNTASLPFIFKHLAVMPDVHAGKGSTIGSVVVTKGAIIPACVGVDIGCGMMAVKTNLTASNMPDNLFAIRTAIEKAVPHGRTDNGGWRDKGAWGEVRHDMPETMKNRLDLLVDKHQKLTRAAEKSPHHLGTLGTGNHFIELCLDENQDVWIMLHSGSRGIGNGIGTYFIELAKEEMRRFFINLPDMDLAYLPQGSKHYDDYMNGVSWAQGFAKLNREYMMQETIKAVSNVLGREITTTMEAVNCFAKETRIITEKGIVEIESVVNQSVNLLTSNGQWQLSTISSFGEQELVELILCRSGVIKKIRCTPEHKWFLHNTQRVPSEATTDQLKCGNRLEISFPLKKKVSILYDAVARGFVYGDGTLSRNGNGSEGNSQALFCGRKVDSMLAIFEGIGNKPRIYNNFIRISGLPPEWKKEKPSINSCDSTLYSWLIGYFTADGEVDRTGRPTMSSACLDDLEYVRDICTKLGIGTFGIRMRMRKGYKKYDTPLYLLGFMRCDLDYEFFLNEHHKIRFVNGRDAIVRKHWKVISVKSLGYKEQVYCATVPGTHSFTLEDNILTGNCHHNYVNTESHFGSNVLVTRKGAVRAREGDLGIIPGSMGAKSFIVRGKGNADSFHSCSHGAGRTMSRTKARALFTVEDHIVATIGVECRKDEEVLDESPGAYKDIEAVMAAQSDLVEIVHTLKQIICVKG